MTAAVAVVSFGAAGARFALPVAAVRRLDGAGPPAPHLAAVLALPPGGAGGLPRVVAVHAAGATRAVTVDGPLKVHAVTAAALVPGPRGWAIPAVLGFALVDDELVQLLDAAYLVHAVPAEAAP